MDPPRVLREARDRDLDFGPFIGKPAYGQPRRDYVDHDFGQPQRAPGFQASDQRDPEYGRPRRDERDQEFGHLRRDQLEQGYNLPRKKDNYVHLDLTNAERQPAPSLYSGETSGSQDLHEAPVHQSPALTTMVEGAVRMVTMLNFMKVELGDHKTLRSKEQWRAAGAECIGTLLFVYLGCGSVVATGKHLQSLSNHRGQCGLNSVKGNCLDRMCMKIEPIEIA